jgi:hypothetical protein
MADRAMATTLPRKALPHRVVTIAPDTDAGASANFGLALPGQGGRRHGQSQISTLSEEVFVEQDLRADAAGRQDAGQSGRDARAPREHR